MTTEAIIEHSDSFEDTFCGGNELLSYWFGDTIKIYYIEAFGEHLTDEISYNDLEAWINSIGLE